MPSPQQRYPFQWGATSWSLELYDFNDVKTFRRVAKTIAGLPFPSRASVIEVFASMGKEGYSGHLKSAGEMKKVAGDLGLRIIACGFNPLYLNPTKGELSPHLTSADADECSAAIVRIKRGISYAAAVAKPGKGILSGPWHTRHQHRYPQADAEHTLLVDILRNIIAPYAELHGVVAAFEPLRAGEQSLIMPGVEAIRIAYKTNKDNIGINGDTVHWASAAEGKLEDSLRLLAASGYLADLHLSEHDRRQWGTGDIGERTLDIFDALHCENYKGPVILENFCPQLHSLLDIHRPDCWRNGRKKTPKEVLYEGAKYLKEIL